MSGPPRRTLTGSEGLDGDAEVAVDLGVGPEQAPAARGGAAVPRAADLALCPLEAVELSLGIGGAPRAQVGLDQVRAPLHDARVGGVDLLGAPLALLERPDRRLRIAGDESEQPEADSSPEAERGRIERVQTAID